MFPRSGTAVDPVASVSRIPDARRSWRQKAYLAAQRHADQAVEVLQQLRAKPDIHNDVGKAIACQGLAHFVLCKWYSAGGFWLERGTLLEDNFSKGTQINSMHKLIELGVAKMREQLTIGPLGSSGIQPVMAQSTFLLW
jgi:hypothetical protein